MKKRLISLIVAVVMLFSMLCPAAYADDETVSFDTCTHEWETPLRSGYSITIPGSDVSFSVKTEQCKKCKWYKHVATIFIAEFTYYSPLNVDANGLVPTELATYWANVWYNNFGKNATATKFAAGGGSTSGGGVGRPKGYADDDGTPSVGSTGALMITAKLRLYPQRYNTISGSSVSYVDSYSDIENYSISKDGIVCVGSSSGVRVTNGTAYDVYVIFAGGYMLDMPSAGYIGVAEGTKAYVGMGSSLFSSSSAKELWSINKPFSKATSKLYGCTVQANSKYFLKFDPIENTDWENSPIKVSFERSLYSTNNKKYNVPMGNIYWVPANSSSFLPYNTVSLVYYPDTSSVKSYNDITINNNTWNGNIYTDNSTNLTYIYPQYTTVNEKNETVTNISNTPIIYNNETKQYYTYDQTTKNYYYITYNAQPTPSPSPTPAPTEKPGGSISTPETGKPGGDAGDTTGILAVLVEIRDNMIQGFLDIKAAFVAGFAELSANFTLAIENLNLNITNIFNKKFPDKSTPETAAPSPSPSPSPSPAPLDPILPETQNLIIPKMNSNTFTDEHGTWIASGSSKYSDVFDFFHAFDRSTSDFWETNASPSYLQIEIPDPKNYYVDGYIMRISKFTNRYAKEWTLQGSDDGKTWDDLDTQKDQNLSDLEEHKYPLTLRKAYKYYRLNMSNYASSMCSLSHFNLLGYDAKDVVTPTPAPTDPPSPSPAPDPGKPDSGDKTNNFWTIIFPNGGGSEDGKKGIFWALVSLILALIAFFANLAVGVGYLFPFLPDGVVMTINTCLIVIFLFTIIKFIMRSK